MTPFGQSRPVPSPPSGALRARPSALAVLAVVVLLALAPGIGWPSRAGRADGAGFGGSGTLNGPRAGQAAGPLLPYLGVTYLQVTPPIVARYRLAVGEGALLTAVDKGSPADLAGLLPGDIVVELAGAPIGAACSLLEMLFYQNAGDPVSIVAVRGSQWLTSQVILGEK